MDLTFYFNRFLKLSKKALSEKDHELITLFARQLQEDIALEIRRLKCYNNAVPFEEFIDSTLHYGGKNENTK